MVESILISTSSGRLLFYRSYSSLSHPQLQDISLALPRQLSLSTQHYYFTHNSHRVLYLPINNLLVGLVTDLKSNIISDIRLIQFLKDVFNSVLEDSKDEEGVLGNFVDLVLACDESVSFGQSSNSDENSVKMVLEMQSTNEKMQQALQREQEKKTKKNMEETVYEIERGLPAKTEEEPKQQQQPKIKIERITRNENKKQKNNLDLKQKSKKVKKRKLSFLDKVKEDFYFK